VRHPLVQRIVEAYERFEERNDQSGSRDNRRDA
jgi:phosphate starvation-inducible PhoH-like protein